MVCSISLLCVCVSLPFTGEQISLRDVKDFPLRLWIIFIVCVAYYVTVFPFIGLAVLFLMEKYGYESKQANIINSLVGFSSLQWLVCVYCTVALQVYIISAVASPFLGVLVDRTGLNLVWLNLGILLTLGAHAMLAFLSTAQWLPYLAMVVMGVAYSLLACALWPLVSFIVPEHQLGTAYGM